MRLSSVRRTVEVIELLSRFDDVTIQFPATYVLLRMFQMITTK